MSSFEIIKNSLNRLNNNETHYDVIIPILEPVLKSAGPRLQYQFNDESNKVIGRSWVLKPTNEKFNNFVPVADYTNVPNIPDNSKYIVIFGQIVKCASNKEALIKIGFEKYSNFPENATHGIETTQIYFPTNPRKSVLVCYDLHNYKRLNNYVNDIVEKINFENNKFKNLTTTKPIVDIL